MQKKNWFHRRFICVSIYFSYLEQQKIHKYYKNAHTRLHPRRPRSCESISSQVGRAPGDIVLFAMNTANLQLFGDRGERHIHPKKWHKMRDKRPLFVARCSQPTNSVFSLGCAGSKFGYFSQFTVFVWKCNMTLIWDLRNLFGIKDETSVNLEISSKAATH